MTKALQTHHMHDVVIFLKFRHGKEIWKCYNLKMNGKLQQFPEQSTSNKI